MFNTVLITLMGVVLGVVLFTFGMKVGIDTTQSIIRQEIKNFGQFELEGVVYRVEEGQR